MALFILLLTELCWGVLKGDSTSVATARSTNDEACGHANVIFPKWSEGGMVGWWLDLVLAGEQRFSRLACVERENSKVEVGLKR